MPGVAIFGIGNVLVGDDAVGPTVVNQLDALWEFPEGVFIEDLGTPSLDLAGRLSGLDAVIFVDAVSAREVPGTICIYRRDEILKHPPGLRLSPHDPSLKETLLTMEFIGDGPKEVILVGIVPKTTEGFGLTEEVRAALPAAEAAVLELLERMGVEPLRRSAPRPTTPWWHAA
jgi:hydrogenase maturation protease